MICKICSRITSPWAKTKILDKQDVQYFRCGNCGFIQTEEPYWLGEAYSESITGSDLGLVGRNIICSTICKALINRFFDADAKFLDYGGGYGLFVRIMRDAGFDFYHYDKFSTNLFAEGAEADEKSEGQYELVTAIEVFEHFARPLDEIAQILRFSGNIFFSTELIPPGNPKPGEWPYYGLEHGQHIALYTHSSLAVIAGTFHLNLYSNGKSLHLLTGRKISARLFRLIMHHRVAKLLDIFPGRKPLLAEDYARVTTGAG